VVRHRRGCFELAAVLQIGRDPRRAKGVPAPVVITKNARPRTVPMSAAFLDLVMKGRVARVVEDLDDDTLRAIAKSAVAPEQDGLNDLLHDWAP
jgi:hypothetical protein